MRLWWGGDSENTAGFDPLDSQGVEADCDSPRPSEGSSPTRTRTWNKPVNSRKNTDRNPRQDNTSDEETAKLSAQLAHRVPADPELARVIAAWPDLAPPIRRAILALVESGRP